MGIRVSTQLITGFLNSLLCLMGKGAIGLSPCLPPGFLISLLCGRAVFFLFSADFDFGVGRERVGGNRRVQGCRPVPAAAQNVILAAVAWANPPAVVAT